MKKLLPALLSVLAACSAPEEISISLAGALSLDADCEVEDFDVFQTGGSVDLGLTTGYIVGFATHSEMQLIETEIGEDVLHSAARNDFMVDTQAVRYYTYPDRVEIAREDIPVLGIIPAGARRTENYFGMNLIGPASLAELRARVPAGSFYQLLVEVQLKGKLRSGQKITTNTASFPLYVSASDAVCPAGTSPNLEEVPEAACGNIGQDGVRYLCE